MYLRVIGISQILGNLLIEIKEAFKNQRTEVKGAEEKLEAMFKDHTGNVSAGVIKTFFERGNYYLPHSRTFEAVDAIADNLLLQMTISPNHPYKHKVYTDTYKSSKFLLVYVVPNELFEDYKKQKWKVESENTTVPNDADEFEQYVIGIDIDKVFLHFADKVKKVLYGKQLHLNAN